ncbi:hypothetical protein B0H11DRAFT_1008472 [Mycena galericulata]|nr:hypothetical protein B0H11DRAFT_1008472 [Mycena galericulata]
MDSGQNGAYCRTVPAEVWLRCFHGASDSDLRCLLSICRYFRELCQPLLFKNMCVAVCRPDDLSRSTWFLHALRLHRSSIRLRALAASAHALSVRCWTFDGNLELSSLEQTHPEILDDGMVHSTYSKLVDLFRTTLGIYQNVGSLRLRGLTIDVSFRATIALLGSLQQLVLSGCVILARTGNLLPIRDFSLFGPLTGDNDIRGPLQLFDIISPETLHCLELDGSREAAALLLTLLQCGTLNVLTSITVQLSDLVVGSFLQLLEICPRLAHLEISPNSSLSSPLPLHLPSTTIPMLQSFKGPHSVSALFLFERPVSVVTFSGTISMQLQGVLARSISDLTHCSVGLRSLSFDVPVTTVQDVTAVVARFFPDIEELSITVRAAGPRFADVDNSFLHEDFSAASYILKHLSTTDQWNVKAVHDPHAINLLGDEEVGGPSWSSLPPLDVTMQQKEVNVIFVASHFTEFANRVCADGLLLPANLVTLRLSAGYWRDRARFSLIRTDQLRLVQALTPTRPALRMLTLGEGANWTRLGDTWCEECAYIPHSRPCAIYDMLRTAALEPA